jgi:cytoskeletal protein CcmA (bactofilin family)
MDRTDITSLGEINALLGRGTEYEGNLTFQGRVRVDGRFRGEIFSEDVLILGDGADVEAKVEVGTLIVRGGRLSGDIEAKQLVEIHAPGTVTGTIRTPQLFVEKGVVLDADCKMTAGEEHTFDDSSPTEEEPAGVPDPFEPDEDGAPEGSANAPGDE